MRQQSLLAIFNGRGLATEVSANLMLSESAGSVVADALRRYAVYRQHIAADLLTPDVGEYINDRQFEFEHASAKKLAASGLTTADLCGKLADRVEHGGAVQLTAAQCGLVEEAIDEFGSDRPREMSAIVESIREIVRQAAAHEQRPENRHDRSTETGHPPVLGSAPNRPRRDAMPEPRPPWQIDDVLARTDLTSLLDHLAEPATHTFRGRRWHCPVPGHDDRHPSVTVHTDHRGHERWRCWSGDDTHRGDAIDLVAATQHLSRADAIDWLARRAGMTPDQPLPPITRRPRPAQAAYVPLDPAVTRYAQGCERILWTTAAGQPVLDWLHQRGFNDDVLHANHVGADPGRRLMPRRRGLPHGTSLAATFPALNLHDEITYVQTRYLAPGDGAKYDNPASALGHNPRLTWTRTPHPQRPDVLIVCEGIPDALTATQAGYQAVGILGAQAPDHTIASRIATHAQQHNERLLAVIDADTAGRTWGQRLGRLLHENDHSLTIIEPPDGLDLNTWAQDDSHWADSIQTRSAATAALSVDQPAAVEIGAE